MASLPALALLGLSSVSNYALEVVKDTKLEERLVATLCMMRVVEITSFEIYEAAGKLDAAMTSRKVRRENLKLAASRLEKCT